MTGVLADTIEQLRAYCAPFAGRVAGAADFRQGLENYNANMALPSAWVVPLDQTVDPESPGQMIGLQQTIHKTIGVVVEFDATEDRRGQDPTRSYDVIEAALFASLLLFKPGDECRQPNQQGYFFAGGRFLDLDRARLFYQWEFTLRYQINEQDAWPGDPGIPLAIEVDIYKAPPFAPLPPADGSPPAVIIKIPTDPGPLSTTEAVQ